MRVSKKHEERKEEIIDIGKRLFYSKGYEKCSVNDILDEAGIAKGTFYYHFKSKEEVLDAVVLRDVDEITKRIEKSINNNEMGSVQKLMTVFLKMRMENPDLDEVINSLHKTENALLHQKNLNQMVKTIVPILINIVSEGIEERVWNCKYPKDYMKIFLVSALTLTDEGIFEFEDNAGINIMPALISMLEKMLEVEENLFLNLYLKNWN